MAMNVKKSWFGQNLTPNNNIAAVVGLQYVLPWLVTADASVDHTGKTVLELSREDIPISRRIRGNISINSDKEFNSGLHYIV